jgi:hypothetical protein
MNGLISRIGSYFVNADDLLANRALDFALDIV